MGAEFARTSVKRTHFTAHFVADGQIEKAIARARRFDDAALLSAGQHHRCNAPSTARSAPIADRLQAPVRKPDGHAGLIAQPRIHESDMEFSQRID